MPWSTQSLAHQLPRGRSALSWTSRRHSRHSGRPSTARPSSSAQLKPHHAMEMACLKPVEIPSATDRMARPLGEATVRALGLLRPCVPFRPH
jgi:hypothetical protein